MASCNCDLSPNPCIGKILYLRDQAVHKLVLRVNGKVGQLLEPHGTIP